MSRTDDEKELYRRNFLKCMAWVGTGACWTLSSGILKGSPLGQSAGGRMMSHNDGALRFVQISDSHIGFVSVPVGATVTWMNHDDVPHNVVSTEQKFKSPVLDTDERFSHRFDAPGAYKYFCSVHPKMTGRIVVG